MGLARKATGFMTNDEYIAGQRLCWWARSHSVVERQSKGLRTVFSTIGGGDIVRFATEHACRGMWRGPGADGTNRQLTIAALVAGPTLEELELLSLLANDGDQEFRDRSTGLPLNAEMVKRARELEMQHMDELKVLEESDPRAWPKRVDHRSRLTGSISTRATRSGPTAAAGWSAKRLVGGQQLMWKIGQQRLPQLPVRGISSAAELDDKPEVTGRRR